MRSLVALVLVGSSIAVAVRVQSELHVFATPDGDPVVAFGADAGTSAFTMVNVGLAPLTLNSITLLGDDAAFSIGSFPASLAQGDSVEVQVEFHPATPGSYAARVMIASDELIGRNSDIVLCAPAPCDPPQPDPLPVPHQRGCSSTGWLVPALAALLLSRRRQTAR